MCSPSLVSVTRGLPARSESSCDRVDFCADASPARSRTETKHAAHLETGITPNSLIPPAGVCYHRGLVKNGGGHRLLPLLRLVDAFRPDWAWSHVNIMKRCPSPFRQ